MAALPQSMLPRVVISSDMWSKSSRWLERAVLPETRSNSCLKRAGAENPRTTSPS